MAYIEHEWTNGETITAAKLNNIEEGIAEAAQTGGGSVASVRVTFSGFEGSSISFASCYGEYIPSREMYSMVSPANEIIPSYYQQVCFVPMCISDETYKAIIAFDEFMFEGATFEVSGNIAQPAVTVQVPSSPTTWNSAILYGFIVNGDGAINVIAP